MLLPASHVANVRHRNAVVAGQIRAAGGGRKMFLTSPFIEQAFTYIIIFAPFLGQSAKG